MQGKKRYLALVLFLLLGLVTFSFANPDEQLEPVEENVKKVSEQKDEKRVQTKFEEAKELVERAEENPTQEIIAEAEEILEEAQQEQPELVLEEDLVNRLNNTEPAIDAAALISAVEKMIDEATKKDDVSAAKTYFDNNGVATVTNTLVDGTVKENLEERVAYLIKVFADEIAPVITGIEDNQTTNQDVTLSIEDEIEVTKVVTLNGEEIAYEDTFTKEGTYNVTVTDDAQNKITLTFTIDKTAIGIKSANMYTNGKKYTVDKDVYYYATEGQKITAYVRLKEQSVTLPVITLTIDGKEYVLENVKESFHSKDDEKNGVYKYEGIFTIPADVEISNAKVSYKITNIKDAAGNETTVTKVTNKNIVVVDTINPVYDNLAIVGGKGYWFGKEYKRYATNGTIVYIHARFKEKLETNPVVTLNDSIQLTKASRKETNGIWIYSYSYKLKENDGLVDGILQVKVTNIEDAAGNSIELTNENCKLESQSEIIIDRTMPTYKFYKEGSSLDKDEIQPTIIDGKMYFNQNVRVRFVEEDSHFTKYVHNDFVNNENKTSIKTWSRETKNDGVHTMKVTDASGNVTEVTFVVDTTAPTYKFYKEGSSLAKDEIQPTIIDGKLYFNQNVRVRFVEDTSFFTQYIHNDFVNNENKTTIKTWTREAKTEGEHTMKVTDAFGHVTEVTFVIDTTPNRITQTFYRGDNVEDKTYYLTNGNKIQFNIGFRELLSEPAKVTIGGKEIELTYEKYVKATNSHMYYGYLEAAADETKLVPGELAIEISNITDPVGNKGFYYQTNGKKVIESLNVTKTTNGNIAIYENAINIVETAEEFDQAISAGGDISLRKSIELTDNSIVIPKDKEVTIYLNNNTISGKSTDAKASKLIQVSSGSKLTLKGNGKIIYEAGKPDTDWGENGAKPYPGYANNTITNNGTLIIDGPTIINNTAKGGASYVIDNYAGSELIIESGTITQAGKDVAIRLFTSTANKPIDVTINGGTITGHRAIWIQLASNKNTVAPIVNLTINGGTLASSDTTYNQAIYSYSYGNSFANTNVVFNGGTFKSGVAFGGGYKGDKENVTINDGTFEDYCGRYLADSGWEDLLGE